MQTVVFQSMEATPVGESGVHVAAAVGKAFRNESDHAVSQNRQTEDDHAAVLVLIPRDAMLDCVQVRFIHFLYTYSTLNH